jgi:tRNA-uridine 2-sulfurtransferase
MKAIALISGGLDSTLAAKVIAGLGIEVIGVHFSHPFCAREKKTELALQELATDLARQAGIELRLLRLDEEFLQMVSHPGHGYGSNVNPCIDCRILMLKKAREIMALEEASFLVTGEVVAQRPMSQQKKTIGRIDREAGVEGIVLRPLSAKLMEETLPEKEGWVDRQKLYAFSGRSRKPQIDLAVMLGLIDFPNAAGGCLLTDPRFSERMKDLMAHGSLTMNEVELLKLGRHFRLSDTAKLIVGRNQEENSALEALAGGEDTLILPPEDVAGATGLYRGENGEQQLRRAAAILCRYCDRAGRETVSFTCRKKTGSVILEVSVMPATEAELEKVRI